MIQLRSISLVETDNSRLKQAEAIRYASFDPGDLVKIETLKTIEEMGIGRYMLVAEDDSASENVLGMCYLLEFPKVTYLLYLVTDETQRSKGVGSRALQEIKQERPGIPVILDIESVGEMEAEDLPTRLRRRDFYVRNQMTFTGYVLADDGGEYDLYSSDGRMFPEEFMRAMEICGFTKYHPYFAKQPEVEN